MRSDFYVNDGNNTCKKEEIGMHDKKQLKNNHEHQPSNQANSRHEEGLVCSDDLFYNDLRAIAEDSAREE